MAGLALASLLAGTLVYGWVLARRNEEQATHNAEKARPTRLTEQQQLRIETAVTSAQRLLLRQGWEHASVNRSSDTISANGTDTPELDSVGRPGSR